LVQPSRTTSLDSSNPSRLRCSDGTTTDDELDPRPDALVVYAVDIWPDGFPGDPHQSACTPGPG
jgi:hypothetical protein